MKTKFLQLKNREKYAIIIIISIIVFTFMYEHVIFDIYHHFAFPGEHSLKNMHNLNWPPNSLIINMWALSGLSIMLGITNFPSVILGTTTTLMFPGMIFFVASMLSIPLMVRLTSGIVKWRRILYIYLVATQLSSLLLNQWSNFGS